MLALAVLASPQAVAETLCFNDGAKATYGAKGRYTYVAANGRTAKGTYSGSPTAGGRVTIDLPGGRTRADSFVREGGQLYLVTKNDNRFPVKPCK